MLSIKERQRLLKGIGLYNDKIDGIEGKNTKKAYLTLQKRYFTRKKDIDGYYGKDTENLLLCVYRVLTYTKNFRPEEFKCGCGGKYCTGYPVALDINLLKYVQKQRDRDGAMNITSGLRCEKYNASVGGIRGSKHTQGKAIDFYNNKTKTLAGRKPIIDWYATNCLKMYYSYCNGYARFKFRREYPSVISMGTSIHFDVV